MVDALGVAVPRVYTSSWAVIFGLDIEKILRQLCLHGRVIYMPIRP